MLANTLLDRKRALSGYVVALNHQVGAIEPCPVSGYECAQPAKHKPWANRQPTNHARGHVPCKVYRGSLGVLMCVLFFSTMRLACAESLFSRSVGLGANASNPPARHRQHDTYCACAPYHTGDRESWRLPEGDGTLLGPSGSPHFMDDQGFHNCVRTQKRRTVTKTLRNAFRRHRVQRLTCETT